MITRPLHGLPAMFYTRRSTDKQSDLSTVGQEQLCRQLAATYQCELVGGRSDEGRTGQTMAHRSGLQEVRQLARDGVFKALFVESLDRLSRNQADIHRLFEDLTRYGVTIVSVQEGVIDALRVTFLGFKAAQDIKQTQERVRRGQTEVLRDRRICGSIGYGYRKVETQDGVNGLRELHPVHSKVVLRILEAFAAGVSALKICARLNADGIPAPRGGKWTPGVLLGSEAYGSGLLRNRMYIGEFVFRRTSRELIPSTGDVITRPGLKANQMVLSVPHLRIASDALWTSVQARLAENRIASNQPLGSRRRATYVFSGKMICGCCREHVVVLGQRVGCNGRANAGNGCPNNVRLPREEVEAAVFAGMRRHLLQPEVLEPYLAEYAEAERRLIATHAGEASRLQSRVSELEKQIDNLLATAAKAHGSPRAAERLIQQVEQLEAERRACEQRLAIACATRSPAPTSAAEVIAGMERLLDDLSGALAGDDPDAVRARDLMRGLVDHVVIEPMPTQTRQRRGSEPVQVIVSGDFDDLFKISQTTLGRVSLSGFQTGTGQAHADRRFSFKVVLTRQLPKFSQTAEDMAEIERRLDEADAPLTNAALADALLAGAHPDPEARRAVELRVRNVMHLLSKAGRVRTVRLGKPVGWVWTRHSLTDDDWRARTADPSGASLPPPLAASASVPVLH